MIISIPAMKILYFETNNSKLYFLDIKISRDRNQLIASVYRKPTLSVVFWCFIRTCCNISLGSTLIFRCYQTRSTLQKPIRDMLLFANLKVIFRMKNRLSSKLTFKGKILKKCILLFCYKFWWSSCNATYLAKPNVILRFVSLNI